jgi:hypothetical protein
MKKGLFNKRIPTTFALLVLIGVIAISTVLVQKGIFYIGKAAPENQPENVSISNVTDTSFTVSFTTPGSVDGVLTMSDVSVGNSLILDDRDKKNGGQGKYYSHLITAPNLKANSKYVFKLLVGAKVYSDLSYSATTASVIPEAPPPQNPIFGKVLLPDGTPARDSIVSAKTKDSQLISAITDEKGQFIIPTNSLRTSNFNQYFILQENSSMTITALRQTMKSTVDTTFSVAKNLPSITLQEQYSFSHQTVETSTEASKLNLTLPTSSGKTVDITNPKEGQTFIDQRPLLTGVAYPNSKVTIQLKNAFEKQVISSPLGTWSFRSDTPLSQGDHILTILTPDNTGAYIRISRNFTIFPLGSQVAQSATPSATPIIIQPTIIPTTVPITPTPTTMVSEAPSPTVSITETIVPTVLPVAESSTPKPTLAKSGTIGNTIALTSVSVILIVAGAALLLAL